MDAIQKSLKKLSAKEREQAARIIEKLIDFDWPGLNVAKLKGADNLFRARKGRIRIVFRRDRGQVLILAIERRSEKTYKNL